MASVIEFKLTKDALVLTSADVKNDAKNNQTNNN